MTYPNERQTEYWTSRAIEEYFENLGYPVVTIPNSQRAEKHIPFDHLFANHRVKLFGLQYKRLYDSPDHWRLEEHQHQKLHAFPWIYYSLSEITSISEHRNALHLMRLVQPSKLEWTTAYSRLQSFHLQGPGFYARWGGFVQGLFQCRFGKVITSFGHLQDLLGPLHEVREFLIDIYIVTPDSSRLVVRRSPFIAELTEGDTDAFDIGTQG